MIARALRATRAIGIGASLWLASAPAGQSAPQSKSGSALAYVSNERSGTVSVIDTATDRVISTVRAGSRPRGIEWHDGRLFVALSDDDPRATTGADAIVALDASGRVAARYDAGSDPERLVISPDGSRLYAANEDAGTATAFDIRRNAKLATLVVGIEPEGVAISPDGRWV